MNTITNEYLSTDRQPIIDPELRDLLPPLSGEAKEALEQDILENGCYSPMICMEDMTLVDGHNRYAICEEYDIPYRIVTLHFEDKLAAKQWALDTQKARRNLTTWELGQIALRLKPEIEAKARAKQAEYHGNQYDGALSVNSPKVQSEAIDTRKELAQSAGVGEQTMGRIMRIDAEAPDPIKEALAQEDISINKGYQLTKRLRDVPEEEREAVARAMLEKIEAEYHKGCDETDRQCDIANQFTAALDKMAQIQPTPENVWYWIDWCGIRPSHIDSMIREVDMAAQKLIQVKEILQDAKKFGNWRNPYAAPEEESDKDGTAMTAEEYPDIA